MNVDVEQEKRLAADAAATEIRSGMRVGLGTGTTVHYLLEALARAPVEARCVATSPRTERVARELGIRVEPFAFERLDLAIDGADQIDADGWLIKGGGGAHTREKLVAAAAERFVVIADSTKLTSALSAPVPLELLAFGVESTIARLGQVRLRRARRSPDGGVLADFVGEVGDAEELATRFATTPGVVEHGLFPPSMISAIFVGRGSAVVRTEFGRR